MHLVPQVQQIGRAFSSGASSSGASATHISPFATAVDGLPAEFVDDFAEGACSEGVRAPGGSSGGDGDLMPSIRQGSLLTLSVRRLAVEGQAPGGSSSSGDNDDASNASRHAFDAQPPPAAAAAMQGADFDGGPSEAASAEWPSATTPTAAAAAASASLPRRPPSGRTFLREPSRTSRRSLRSNSGTSATARRSSLLLQVSAGSPCPPPPPPPDTQTLTNAQRPAANGSPYLETTFCIGDFVESV